MNAIRTGLKVSLPIILLAVVIVSQIFYDKKALERPIVITSPSPRVVAAADLGLHSAAASFWWLGTITQLPFFQQGASKFFADFHLINELDPRFSFPYAFTVAVLPSVVKKYPNAVEAAIQIGRRGVEEADPDWRVPFYLAITYHLNTSSTENAAKYFDIAATTAGAPDYVRMFSINYGIAPTKREKTKEVWLAIYNTTKNKDTKERARKYVVRLEIFNVLDEAINTYSKKMGVPPRKLEDLISAGVIREIPKDPYGYEFIIGASGKAELKR